MFGGNLTFYTKESKALNINMKTDYWAHPKTGSITQQKQLRNNQIIPSFGWYQHINISKDH